MPSESPKPGTNIPDDVAEFLADSLGETEELPRSQIAKVLKALGREETVGMLHEVERIEASGGMLIPDGSRRRTPGGVFFHLARQRLPRPLRYRIFAPPRPPEEPAVAAPVAAPPPPPPAPKKPSSGAPSRTRPRVVEVEYIRRRPPSAASADGSREPAPAPAAQASSSSASSRPAAASAPAPSRGAAPPATKKEFVLRFPSSTPVAEIIEAASRQHLSISASYVYSVRRGQRR